MEVPVLTAVSITIIFFWDVTRYILVDKYQRFGETYCLLLRIESIYK
jgi:hypothetical protein